jgi:hypothetical protein
VAVIATRPISGRDVKFSQELLVEATYIHPTIFPEASFPSFVLTVKSMGNALKQKLKVYNYEVLYLYLEYKIV